MSTTFNDNVLLDSGARLGVGSTSPSYLVEVAMSGSGLQDLMRLQNAVAAANGSGAQLLFGANRTTAGMTNVAGVAGLVTDISASAYKGALAFLTASNAAPAERMRIDDAGNVGIGTSSPTQLLTVYGDSKRILMQASSSGGQTGILFQSVDGSSYKSEILHDTGNLALKTTQNGTLATRVWISGAGNVGIGTSSPIGLLNIYGDSQRLVMQTNSSSGQTGVLFQSADGTSNKSEILHDTGNLSLKTTQNGTLATRVWISGTNGDVGVGTDAPTKRLDVNGDLRVRGIVEFDAGNTTGSGSAALGANSPAIVVSAPYTWIQIVTQDGSTAYVPAWK